jgi:DNA-binding MarR family transcriptional regulator
MDARERHSNLDQGRLEEGIYLVEEQIGFLLRVAFQYHTAIFTLHMVADLTQTQYATLSHIHTCLTCSQADLVSAIELDSATINGVVSRMRARGLLAIAADPSDRRRQFLSLTTKGKKVMEQAESVGSIVSEKTLELLTPTEQMRLVHLLHKMMGRTLPARRERTPARSRKSPVKLKRSRNGST